MSRWSLAAAYQMTAYRLPDDRHIFHSRRGAFDDFVAKFGVCTLSFFKYCEFILI